MKDIPFDERYLTPYDPFAPQGDNRLRLRRPIQGRNHELGARAREPPGHARSRFLGCQFLL